MSCFGDECFKHRGLVHEVFLFVEKTCHTTVIILKRANRSTLHFHVLNIKPPLLKNTLQTFRLTIIQRHFLRAAAKLREWIQLGNDSIILFTFLGRLPLLLLIDIIAEKIKVAALKISLFGMKSRYFTFDFLCRNHGQNHEIDIFRIFPYF